VQAFHLDETAFAIVADPKAEKIVVRNENRVLAAANGLV
jgi:hypothetical protein